MESPRADRVGTPVRPTRWTRGWLIRTTRKWHRWIGFTAGLFLIFVSTTGFLVAFTEFFGEEKSTSRLVVAMLWGLALLLMSVSGLWIYWSMRRNSGVGGLRKVFW